MENVPNEQEFGPRASLLGGLFIGFFLIFIATGAGWGLLAGLIHNFAVPQPDAAHGYAVHEHGGTFYLSQKLGRFYTNLPRIWISLLVIVAVLYGLVILKSRRKA